MRLLILITLTTASLHLCRGLPTTSEDTPTPMTTTTPTPETTTSIVTTTSTSTGTSATDRPAPRVKHINMTQVDEMYVRGHKDEQEIKASWYRMSRRLKSLVGQAIGSVMPYALNLTQEARINDECAGDVLKWVFSLNHLKSWALRMLDASGKPIAGMLEGSLTLFGNYRECLKIRAPDDDEMEFSNKFQEKFRGKYCIIQAKPWLPAKGNPFYNLNAKIKGMMLKDVEKTHNSIEESDVTEMDTTESNDDRTDATEIPDETTTTSTTTEPPVPEYEINIFDELSDWIMVFNFINVRFDICVPSTCSREDIQKAITFLLKDVTEIKARVARCEMDPPDGSFGGAVVESGPEQFAGAMNVEPNSIQQANNIGDLSVLGLTVQAAPTLNGWSRVGWFLVPAIPIIIVLIATLLSATLHKPGDTSKRGRLNSTISSLSLKRSVSSHLNVDYNQLADDKPLALYGIRFILVLWVILVESAVNLKFEYLRELMMLKDLIFWWPMQFVINSTLQFDSIILLTAFTMAYKNCLNDSANSLKSLLKFLLDKYVRLMPSIMIMVALVIVLPVFYGGPVWNDYVLKQSAACQTTGWLNSVFLQNYLPYKEICLPQTWLMCVEFQLILLMTPLVYYLDKRYFHIVETRNHNSNFKNTDKQLVHKNSINNGNLVKKDKFFYWLRTIPGLISVACIAIGLGSSFYNVYTRKLPPTWFYTMADPESKGLYFDQHLMRLCTHLAVFTLGIIAGIECRRAARDVTMADDRTRRGQRRLFNGNPHGIVNISSLHNGLRGNKANLFSTSMPAISETTSSAIFDSTSNHEDTSVGPAITQSTSNPMSTSSATVNLNGSYDSINSPSQYNNADSIALKCSDHLCDSETDTNYDQDVKCYHLLINTFGFLLTITTMTTIIFSTHGWSVNDLPEPLVAGLFDAGSRFLWSLALIWILYMVSVPNRDREFSLLARALGSPGMVCLGKLSFLIYIIHPFVHTAVLAIQEQPIYSSWLMLFHILIGNITITVILSSLMSLFVEMPCRNLFRRCGTSLLLTPTSSASINDVS